MGVRIFIGCVCILLLALSLRVGWNLRHYKLTGRFIKFGGEEFTPRPGTPATSSASLLTLGAFSGEAVQRGAWAPVLIVVFLAAGIGLGWLMHGWSRRVGSGPDT